MKAGWERAGWLAALVVLAGCDNVGRQPNRRPLTPSLRSAPGSSARLPPAQAVAWRGPAGGAAADAPPPLTAALLQRGRERFEIYCAVCHGADGAGRGIVVRRGFPPPPSLQEERLRAAPPGYFFTVITQGYGVMLPIGPAIPPADRWAIVAYLRALQRSQHASAADLAAAAAPPRPAR